MLLLKSGNNAANRVKVYLITILALSLGEMGSTRLRVGLSNVSTESTFKLILQEGSRVEYCGFPQVDEL